MLAIPSVERKKNASVRPQISTLACTPKCKPPHGTKDMWVLQGHQATRTGALVEANDPATGTESTVASVKMESAIADASQ
jgi:hypothetical protein